MPIFLLPMETEYSQSLLSSIVLSFVEMGFEEIAIRIQEMEPLQIGADLIDLIPCELANLSRVRAIRSGSCSADSCCLSLRSCHRDGDRDGSRAELDPVSENWPSL
jgi:hypothetical protein